MAVSVEYAVEEAMDLSQKLFYDNDGATGWKAEKQWFNSCHRQGSFIYTKASGSAQWPCQQHLKGHRKIILLQ